MSDGQPHCWLSRGDSDRATVKLRVLLGDDEDGDEVEDGTGAGDDYDVPADIASIASGGTLYDGDYSLSFNNDAEGFWFLRFDDDTAPWSCSFDSVTGLGDGGLALLDRGGGMNMWADLREAAPRIDAILCALARGVSR